MSDRLGLRVTCSAGLLALSLLAAGCMSETFSGIELGMMSRAAVGRALGPAAVETADGYSLDEHNPWPTVVGFVHVAVPQAGSAGWKLDFQGAVVHVIALQTWNLRIRYDGPLPEDVLNGLRVPDAEEANEFRGRLADLVDARVRTSMTDAWRNAEGLKSDPYRSRFLGLYDASLSDVRGRGTLHRERFSADVDAGLTSLTVRYLGAGTYRVELHTSAVLGPLPIL